MIYAAEAARAFSPQRRDVLVKTLLEVAEEAVNPVAAGEVEPPKPDWRKAAGLCEKVLDMPITGEVYRVLFESKSPAEATNSLMHRPQRSE